MMPARSATMGEAVRTVRKPGLQVSVFDGDEVVISFEGVLSDRDPESWMPTLLNGATARMDSRSEVVLDLTELSYMNSGGFRVLIQWLKTFRQEHSERVLRVRANRRHLWQRVGLATLQVVGDEHVVISGLLDGQSFPPHD